MVMKIRNWLRRLFCFHLHWERDPFPPSDIAWHEHEWQCSACGKRKVREMNWLPVNYVDVNG